eukprot:6285502-Prymnesium_polylepis.1
MQGLAHREGGVRPGVRPPCRDYDSVIPLQRSTSPHSGHPHITHTQGCRAAEAADAEAAYADGSGSAAGDAPRPGLGVLPGCVCYGPTGRGTRT